MQSPYMLAPHPDRAPRSVPWWRPMTRAYRPRIATLSDAHLAARVIGATDWHLYGPGPLPGGRVSTGPRIAYAENGARAVVSLASFVDRAATIARERETAERVRAGAYHCPCGWSRVILTDGAEAREAHERTMVHAHAERDRHV